MNVPKLRFPEFKGEWEKKKLGEVVKINQGLQIAISERLTEQVDDSYFYITNEFLRANSDKKYFIKNPPKSVLCTKDDILMTRTGNTGMVVTNVSGAFHNNFFKVAYPNYISKNFLYNFLKLEKTQNQILRMAGTSTIPDLNHGDFYRIVLPFPSLPEQKRIASFFTVLDKKIAELKQKKNLLEQYKKGVMQRLFLSELGLVGLEDDRIDDDKNENPTILKSNKSKFRQLRFKDNTSTPLSAGNGKEFPKWEKKKLGEVCEIKKGEQLNKEELTEVGTYPCLNGGINYSGYTEKFNADENTITISEGGNSCGYINFLKTKFWLGGHCYKIILISQIDLLFFFQLLKFNEEKIMKLRVGSGLPNIQQKDLRNFEFVICNSFEEQTKIANFLSALDEKINQTENQIQQTQQWKKGLLQKMFV